VNPDADLSLTVDEQDDLISVADLVTLARTAVIRDQMGNVIDAHAPEAPTRFVKQLQQVARGAIAIGVERDEAVRLALRVARDSLPPLRKDCLLDLAAHPDSLVSQVRKRLNKPRSTVDRELQALHQLGVLTLDEVELGNRVEWRYRLANDEHAHALKVLTGSPEMSVEVDTLVAVERPDLAAKALASWGMGAA
jgi:predicted transcriptional regulator